MECAMKHRRRSCVRSSAPPEEEEEEEKDSKHFMKAILPSPFHSKQIRIPDEFITRFGNELSNVAKITVPDGRQWNMELKKCGRDVFLCNKWQEFAEYYSISYGCYLDFKYEGNSEFNVVIYDTTSLEISYPSKTPSTNGESNTKDTAFECNPKNPSFRSKYMKAARGPYVYVPFEFAAEYLKLKVPFMLQNPQGKQWKVSCIMNNKRSSTMRIIKGLPIFARENNLLRRCFYVFELIKTKPVVVLRVTPSPTLRQKNSVPSSAEEEVRESKHFKKAILPSPIHAKQMKIPDNFITIFGNELNNVAKVTVPDGRVWDIELKKCGENVFFCNKWQQFAEFYSIEYGCYLSFKYEGNSMFSVIIVDATSVEIVYPPFKTNGEPKRKCGRPRKKSRVEMNDADDLASAEDQGSKNPSFTSTIRHQRMYIHADFAKKYLKPDVAVKVQNCNGEQWEIDCVPNDYRSSAMRMGRGFTEFLRDNNLSDGDECKVELIKEMPVVLKLLSVSPAS
ncbi:unnamed protein product [Trifolium pratense]|uniref:Uncharacterized protein n=1 Tax=Trifolium pratense TaxID=57577 RepID=A0ACB0J3U1_TRIPR|nr:unnamed protein product [Trifolium pratense]